METELKFMLSPQRQRKVETALGKLSRSMSEPKRRHEITRYFDFADQSLFNAGFSLRVRHSDGAGYVQTLKALSGTGGAALQRFEREWVLARGRLDVTKLAGTPVSRLMAAKREAPIREVFATDILRVTYSLALDDDAIVELAIDNGHVRSGETAQAIHEIEIELKAGNAAPLYRFASALHESCPLTISSDSKAARGYRLAAGGRFKARKTDDIELPHDVSLADGFRRILGSGLGQFVANLPFCSADDPEPLHQSRIAIRRMRSALALFDSYLEPDAACRFEGELKRFGRILGAARDRDVFLKEIAAQKKEDRGKRRMARPGDSADRGRAAGGLSRRAGADPLRGTGRLCPGAVRLGRERAVASRIRRFGKPAVGRHRARHAGSSRRQGATNVAAASRIARWTNCMRYARR